MRNTTRSNTESSPTKKNKAKACSICAKPFTLTRVAKICKRCSKWNCAECTRTSTISTTTEQAGKPQTVCTNCEDDLNFHDKLKRHYGVSWNKITKIGKKWLDSNKQLEESIQPNQFEKYISIFDESDTLKNNILGSKESGILNGLDYRSNFNIPMQELLQCSLEANSQDDCRNQVLRVVKAFCAKNPNIGTFYGLEKIVAFLLVAFDEEHAFWVLCYIIENICPTNYFNSNAVPYDYFGLRCERKLITNLINGRFKNEIKLESVTKTFLEQHLPTLLLSLYVDACNIEVLFKIWGEMIKTSTFDVIDKASLAIILLTNQKFKDVREMPDTDSFINYIWKEFSIKYYKETIAKFEVLPTEMAELRAEAEKELTQELTSQAAINLQVYTDQREIKGSDCRTLYLNCKDWLERKAEIGKLGFDKKGFIEFINDVQEHNMMGFWGLSNENLDLLYEMIDVNNEFCIGYKELSCFLFIILRETLKEKIELLHKLSRRKNKDMLDEKDFLELIQIVCTLGRIFAREDINPNFQKSIDEFREIMNIQAQGMGEMASADLVQALSEQKFVQAVYKKLQEKVKTKFILEQADKGNMSPFSNVQGDKSLIFDGNTDQGVSSDNQEADTPQNRQRFQSEIAVSNTNGLTHDFMAQSLPNTSDLLNSNTEVPSIKSSIVEEVQLPDDRFLNYQAPIFTSMSQQDPAVKQIQHQNKTANQSREVCKGCIIF